MKQNLKNFELKLNHNPIRCKNISAINLIKNLIQNSRTKQLKIEYHFLCDNMHKSDVVL